MSHPLGNGQIVDRRQVPDLGHFLEGIVGGRIQTQARGGDVARHQVDPVERVRMAGLDLAEPALRHGHVLRLDQADGPDPLATRQQAREQGRSEKSREPSHQQCSHANRLLNSLRSYPDTRDYDSGRGCAERSDRGAAGSTPAKEPR